MPGGVGGQRCEPLPTRLASKIERINVGAEHRNIERIGDNIPVLCTLIASYRLFCYKYSAALSLSGKETPYWVRRFLISGFLYARLIADNYRDATPGNPCHSDGKK
jgi:hypothetical protein